MPIKGDINDLKSRINQFVEEESAKLPSQQHPEDKCQECGAPNPLWYGENGLFNEVNGSPAGIICPMCFQDKATEKGIDIIFVGKRFGTPTTISPTDEELEREIVKILNDEFGFSAWSAQNAIKKLVAAAKKYTGQQGGEKP